MRAYEIRLVVGFEETNLVGNVYYVNHIRWQGKCREMFLRDHAPDVVAEIANGLALATVRCSCDYLAELEAFDEVAVRMRLTEMVQNRVTMRFEYWRVGGIGPRGQNVPELIARGEQQIACMRREDGRTVPTAIPESLREGLLLYSE
ncbi:MAG TPA: acyl-CoA thioesterase [Thermoanaerobaculia bacterium]|nr:acyl-CoA thioesterase [Thermoanaerobaculia bacterium]